MNRNCTIPILVALLSSIFWGGCSTPATPDLSVITNRHAESKVFTTLPEQPPLTIQPGDTLSIQREYVNHTETYLIGSDGGFSYPYIGWIQAAKRTPIDLAAELSKRLADVYRHPNVIVNVVASPNNRAFIGGEVRNPGSVELAGELTLQKSILMVGGLLKSANQSLIALIRLNQQSHYVVYFFRFDDIFAIEEEKNQPVLLQQGDIVFVPKSNIGSAAEFMDIYVKQLLPFNPSVGVGITP